MLRLLMFLAILLLAACAPAVGQANSQKGDPPSARSLGLPQVGTASWYGAKFAGRKTSSGAVFNPGKLTAASRTLPFGTRVKVTNLNNSNSVVVRINDRGPFMPGRIIDLSKAAAAALGMLGSGTARVRLELVSVEGEPVWAAAVSSALTGYRIITRFYPPGKLLYLTSQQAKNPLLVRVVAGDIEPSVGADFLLSPQLYALLGDAVHLAPSP
jgi:rare lipoprotein A